MRPFSSLFAKILVWLFMNLALLAAVLLVFFEFQPHLDLHALLGRPGSDQLRVNGRFIAHDLGLVPRSKWQGVLARYGNIHQVDFALVFQDGQVVSALNQPIPEVVLKKVMARQWPPSWQFGRRQDRSTQDPSPAILPDSDDRPGRQHAFDHDPDKKDAARRDYHHNKAPRLMMRTTNPTQYWAGVWIPVLTEKEDALVPAMLLAVSDSITGKGLFFDPLPWMIVTILVLVISILLWVPLVRNITRPIRRMTQAAEDIARGRFDVRIAEERTDEIGRLAEAINRMTDRLHGFVKGQKRFLSDAAHELASPVARIQLGLGILERQSTGAGRERVADVMADVTQLSDLINELLSFSRADMSPARVRPAATALRPLVERAVQRETASEARILMQIDPDIRVMADAELLTRAMVNLIRNAVRYAASAGPITISACKEAETVVIDISDQGPGVPEAELDQLFEPFFRPETARTRNSGGVGLGLAIVKTCILACKGTVWAGNLDPKGFSVKIRLQSGQAAAKDD